MYQVKIIHSEGGPHTSYKYKSIYRGEITAVTHLISAIYKVYNSIL